MTRLLLIAALAASSSAAPALAQADNRAVVVNRADLDLTRSSDVARLDARIARAAYTACGAPSPTDLVARNEHPRCVQEAVAAARIQRDGIISRSTRSARASTIGFVER